MQNSFKMILKLIESMNLFWVGMIYTRKSVNKEAVDNQNFKDPFSLYEVLKKELLGKEGSLGILQFHPRLHPSLCDAHGNSRHNNSLLRDVSGCSRQPSPITRSV